MTISLKHSMINNSKPTVNHANIYPYYFKIFETNIKFGLRDFKQSILKKITEISEIFNFRTLQWLIVVNFSSLVE